MAADPVAAGDLAVWCSRAAADFLCVKPSRIEHHVLVISQKSTVGAGRPSAAHHPGGRPERRRTRDTRPLPSWILHPPFLLRPLRSSWDRCDAVRMSGAAFTSIGYPDRPEDAAGNWPPRGPASHRFSRAADQLCGGGALFQTHGAASAQDIVSRGTEVPSPYPRSLCSA